jgi:hypothetical protein
MSDFSIFPDFRALLIRISSTANAAARIADLQLLPGDYRSLKARQVIGAHRSMP